MTLYHQTIKSSHVIHIFSLLILSNHNIESRDDTTYFFLAAETRYSRQKPLLSSIVPVWMLIDPMRDWLFWWGIEIRFSACFTRTSLLLLFSLFKANAELKSVRGRSLSSHCLACLNKQKGSLSKWWGLFNLQEGDWLVSGNPYRMYHISFSHCHLSLTTTGTTATATLLLLQQLTHVA